MMKQGTFQWDILRELSSGTGQGNVSLVSKQGSDEPALRMFMSVHHLLILHTPPTKQFEEQRREFEMAFLDFVEHKYNFGALKQLKNLNDEEAKGRLRMEAALYGLISDPHLIKLLDVNLAENEHWIVTEYQPNKTLEQRLTRFKGDAVGTLKAIRPVVNVLAKLHFSPQGTFVHRDFKPGNIFIGREGQFILGDAGLVFYDGQDARLTKSHESAGTHDYMPAWTYGGRADINPTFDIFSVGKVIWAMLAGQRTCPLWYCLEEKFDLTRRFPDVPEMIWINRLLKKCVVEKEAQMKIKDAKELLFQIDETLRGIESQAVPPEVIQSDPESFRCSVCSVGHYKRFKFNFYPVGSKGKTYQCNECEHVILFYRED
jgi:serine/threonine protein kinase